MSVPGGRASQRRPYRCRNRVRLVLSFFFAGVITPRPRDPHPTLGAHVEAPLPPRRWHFPHRNHVLDPLVHDSIARHGHDGIVRGPRALACTVRTVPCTVSRTISVRCDKFMTLTPPLWLKFTGYNPWTEKGPVTTTRKDAPLLRREESGTVYLSPWTKGCRYRSADRIKFNFVQEVRRWWTCDVFWESKHSSPRKKFSFFIC